MKATFFEDVYEVVKLVPPGRVTTYGAIANYLGTKGSARMVGWAMNAVVDRNDVPAHRVVNRNGILTGKMHFNSPDEMEKRLKDEGIHIQHDQISNFQEILWDPMKELKL